METRKLINIDGNVVSLENVVVVSDKKDPRIDTDGDGVVIMPALNSKVYEEVGRMCNRASWIHQLAAAANTLIDAWKE